MNGISFGDTANQKLTHLSYIVCKPEALGGDFNTVACSVASFLLFLEIQRET